MSVCPDRCSLLQQTSVDELNSEAKALAQHPAEIQADVSHELTELAD